ncbi:MAG: BatD family protein [Planctomycetia bacterium]|nr:BatD family protein [Planctomycetia bacterium]
MSVQVRDSEIFLDESTTLSLVFSGLQDAPQVDLSYLEPNWNVVPTGQSRRSEFTGFGRNSLSQMTLTLTYRLSPKHAGDLVIPSPEVEIDGKKLSAEPLHVLVKERAKIDDVLLECNVDGDEPLYPLSPFTVTISVYVKEYPEDLRQNDPIQLVAYRFGAPLLTIPWLDSHRTNQLLVSDVSLEDWLNSFIAREYGFSINRLQRGGGFFDFSLFDDPQDLAFLPKAERVVRKDKNHADVAYTKYSFARQFRATSAGTIHFDPTTLRGAFFDFSDPNQVGSQSVYLATDPVDVVIKAVPENDAPDNYIGVIGQIKETVSVSSESVQVGEAFSINVSYTGAGSFDAVSPLDLNERLNLKDALKIYPATEKSLPDGVEYEYKARPTKPGDIVIPSINSSYFDVEQRKFVLMTSSEIKIHVEPNANRDEELSNQDDTETDDARTNVGDQLGTRIAKQKRALLGLLTILAACALAFGGFLGARAFWRYNTERIASSNRHMIELAHKRLEHGVALLNTSPLNGLTEIRLAFLQLVGKRIKQPLDALTDAEVLEFLAREFKTSNTQTSARENEQVGVVQDLCAFLKQMEQYKFAGSSKFDEQFNDKTRLLFNAWVAFLKEKIKKLSSYALPLE